MTTPLRPKPSSAMNAASIATPTTERHNRPLFQMDSTPTASSVDEFEDAPSSPFVSDVTDVAGAENTVPKLSPSQERGPILSPLRPLKSRATPSPIKPNLENRNCRRVSSPIKRFPVKVSISSVERPMVDEVEEKTVSLDEVLRDNEGLTKAIQIMEDEDSILDLGAASNAFDDTMMTTGDAEHEHFADETAFSTFSAVPDMTMFAKIGHSPSKFAGIHQTPRPQSYAGPTPRSRAFHEDQDDSPTPRKAPNEHKDSGNGNTTNLILDFTEQFSTFSRGQQSPSRNGRMSPSKTVPDLLSYTQNARTPSPAKQRHVSPTNRMSHLLDFDIPPAPTPRSMPSITPRELESLKSGFLSEISSLKASLSGKEAEVSSLKTAVGDAEKRVGHNMEQLREETAQREQLAIEKEQWEKRAREMEDILRNVKEELIHGEKEKESLEGRLQESEMRREMAETMAQEAESKMAGMKAGSASLSASTGSEDKKSTAGSREVEIAVEKVARELHTLYKGKHETKVAALKKSYEGKWDKRVRDLESRIEELAKENEDLKTGNAATMSNVIPNMVEAQLTEELKQQAAKDAMANKELGARLDGLTEEIRSVKRDNDSLRSDLEKERVEKGELVAACDELLALQESVPTSTNPVTRNGVENLRGSISKVSGLRAPGSYSTTPAGQRSPPGPSRIAKMDRHRSGSSHGSVSSIGGLSRPGSGLGMQSRSGIMSSIEKMGSYKGRGPE